MLTEEAELRDAAAAVADRFPRAAARLRAWAMPPEKPDPLRLRKLILRRLWRDHLPGLSRTNAARVLAAAWAAWRPGNDETPGSMGEAFSRLHRVGIRPRSAWTIIKDLDPSLD